jgi:hypothetical protein
MRVDSHSPARFIGLAGSDLAFMPGAMTLLRIVDAFALYNEGVWLTVGRGLAILSDIKREGSILAAALGYFIDMLSISKPVVEPLAPPVGKVVRVS